MALIDTKNGRYLDFPGVVSVATNVNNVSNVLHHATMFGIEAEVLDNDGPHRVYVDLSGDTEKCIRVMLRSGAERVDFVDGICLDAKNGYRHPEAA